MKPLTLVRIRIVMYSLWALFNAWATSMAGVKWASMGWEEKSCLIVGIGGSWLTTMIAFFDKSVWRYDAEKEKQNSNAQPEKVT